LPSLVEFTVDGAPWLCQRFNLLATEIPLQQDQLALFHSVAISKPRGWLIVRRLFGIWPVVPPSGTDTDDLRLWQREELREALGLTRPQLQAELDAVRGAWQGVKPKEEEVRGQRSEVREPRAEFEFPDSELLKRHGFGIRFQNSEEAAWFAQRVRDYEKVLNEKFASGLARNALMTELRIYQIDAFLNDSGLCKTGCNEWKTNLKLRQELDSNYQDQIAQIKELCPWAGAIAGKFTFTGTLSDVTKAVQEYAARNDTRLIDGIFAATEILVECRRSTQAPEPRYRAGLVVFLNAAKAGLWDPNWKPPFEPPKLKQIDAAWKAALAAAGDEAGEKVPDLEQDGPGGEYEEPAVPANEVRSPKQI
jgi:hypothetical protein